MDDLLDNDMKSGERIQGDATSGHHNHSEKKGQYSQPLDIEKEK
jgi:hypothetical protein